MNFYFPCNILFGDEHVDEFVNYFLNYKVAIITNKGKNRLGNKYVLEILKHFEKESIDYIVIDCVQPNPTYENTYDAVNAIKANNCTAVLAIGGGSCIDCAKAAAFCAINNEDLWFYVNNLPNGHMFKSLPLGIIATTAGTGSEINCCAVITKNNEKKALVCDAIYPKIVLIIPEITTSLPLQASLYQTLDCMYHAIEGFLSINSNAFSQICSITCIKLCLMNIDNLILDPLNTTTRKNLCLASLFSSMSDMYGGCLSAHSLGHAITAYHPEIPHGMSITMIAKEYYSKMLNTDNPILLEKKAKLIELFKECIPNMNIDHIDDFGQILDSFFKYIGLKNISLKNNGINENESETLYLNARKTVGILFNNDPIPLWDDDFIKIISKSM